VAVNELHRKIYIVRTTFIRFQYIMFTALPTRGFMMAWKDNTIGEQKNVAFNSQPGFNQT
jgi:hypothetical protein